ncbi:uncharacterized protein AKAME5_002960000 [Lates japonicus]|uniref:Uncharacterized protein n=1 Tax=Lates japonicus TaxID=270547 RepID=A0AAD3M7D0_LATJO|nr:uncharacterized protein AKAME5_002960000 [Lates japonicus]
MEEEVDSEEARGRPEVKGSPAAMERPAPTPRKQSECSLKDKVSDGNDHHQRWRGKTCEEEREKKQEEPSEERRTYENGTEEEEEASVKPRFPQLRKKRPAPTIVCKLDGQDTEGEDIQRDMEKTVMGTYVIKKEGGGNGHDDIGNFVVVWMSLTALDLQPKPVVLPLRIHSKVLM